ncbi:phosphatidylglycerol lysyltransferase domain-containing protein [Nibricoccus sp. IMCC34717]|uniref:phosphatidylglycerol lysyltransferase domain-containing protein n=1 Tax=Nibricoccus sp. IMCC34717 TaxID=3034021 RepID=UPI00384F8EC8
MLSLLRRFCLLLFPVGWLVLATGIRADTADATGWPAEAVVPGQSRLLHLRLYEPYGTTEPRAVVVFGSGDGGWSYWEDTVSDWMAADGVAVVGLDLAKYSKTDFTQLDIASDHARAARLGLERWGRGRALPVFYAGWSMGAAQAVAAAAKNGRPAELRGLLLLSADSRGRYGLRPSDEIGITPTGPGTWPLSQFSADMDGLRVVQFHGTADFMASTAWVHSLRTPHQLYLMQGANHGFDGPAPEFRPILLQGIAWAAGDDSAAAPEEPMGRRYHRSVLVSLFLALAGLVVALVSRRLALLALAGGMVATGVASIIEALHPKAEPVLASMEEFFPLQVEQHSRFLSLVVGVLLILLARGLLRRKRVAWLTAVAVMATSSLVHVFRAFDWHHSILAGAFLAVLLFNRREFKALSDAPSVRTGIKVGIFGLVLLWSYGTLSLHQMGLRGLMGDAVTWPEAAQASAATLLQLRTELNDRAGREATEMFDTLRWQAALTLSVTLWLLLKPVVLRRPNHSPAELERARAMVAEWGDDPMAAFALADDKHLYFHPEGAGFVAYALWRDIAVALADPIARPEQRAEVAEAFVAHCRRCDWKPVFYCLRGEFRETYETIGLALLRIAEDARIRLADFRLEGTRFQNLRTARNKARRNGLVFAWYQPGEAQVVDEALEQQLAEVSRGWLARKHGGEMGFDLGVFSPALVRERGVACARTADGTVVAFATWNPYASGRGRCLDLMRGRADARDVVDFVILESMEKFAAEGVEEVSLGNAPLANTAAEGERSVRDQAVRFVYENFDRFYGYKRLFSFKQKYYPRWEPRYVAYTSRLTLPEVGMAIAAVHLPRGFRGLLRS